MALASAVVVIAGAAATARVNAWVALPDALSATLAVKGKLPAAVGAPEILPVASIVRPAGSAPALMDQVNGATPPDAASVCVYAALAVTAGNTGAVAIVSPEVMVIVNWLVAGALPALSLNFTVKVNDPADVGLPVMAPDAAKVKPGGGVPPEKAHVNGGAPPDPLRVWL